MKTSPEAISFFVNIYKDYSTGTLSVSRGIHESVDAAKTAANGTCASGRRRYFGRKRVILRAGEFDR